MVTSKPVSSATDRKRLRLEEPAAGILHPDERLRPHGAAAAQVEDRLIGEPEAPLVDRPAEHPLRSQPSDRPGTQVLVEDLRSIPAAVLRPVQSEVRLLKKGLGAVAGIGRDGDADAHGAHELLLTHSVRLSAGFGYACAELDGRLRVHDILGHHDEFVPPETSEGVRPADEPEEPLGHRLQDRIAHPMAQ